MANWTLTGLHRPKPNSLLMRIGNKPAGIVLIIFSLCTHSVSGQQTRPGFPEFAKEQDWKSLYLLLDEERANVNSMQPDGTTALAWAVYWDNWEATRRLLAKGADPDAANDYGINPLILAVRNRSPAMVRILLENGADPNIRIWSGETPLMTASKTGNTEIMKLLLEHGADIDAMESRRGQTALMWAIYFGHPDAARLLIENGADVNAETKMLQEDFSPMTLQGYLENVDVTPRGGYSPLMFAARTGDRETTRLLLERGASVNSVSNDQGPPLVIAAAAGHEDLALYLLEQGADPNLTDINGMTALHYALRDGLKPLHNIKITGKPAKHEQTALLPGGNMRRLIRALLAKGADPNAAMKYPPPILRVRPARIPRFHMLEATPFLLAAAALDLDAMEMLLEAGADPLRGTALDEATFDEETRIHSSENQILGDATPFMAAVGMGRRTSQSFTPEGEERALEAARMLLALGADVNEPTATGWTPLHAAAFIGADRLVTFLVKHGAEINVRNGCGQTPLSLASRASVKGLIEIELPTDIRESTAALLRNLGADDSRASGPVGDCVLGRAGLEQELRLQEQIRIP